MLFLHLFLSVVAVVCIPLPTPQGYGALVKGGQKTVTDAIGSTALAAGRRGATAASSDSALAQIVKAEQRFSSTADAGASSAGAGTSSASKASTLISESGLAGEAAEAAAANKAAAARLAALKQPMNPVKALKLNGAFKGERFSVSPEEVKSALATPTSSKMWEPYGNLEEGGKSLFQTPKTTQLWKIRVGEKDSETWKNMRVIGVEDNNGKMVLKGVIEHTKGVGNFFKKANFVGA